MLIFKLAHKELFSQRKLMSLLLINLTLGFLGLFLLESVKSMVQAETSQKAKEILGADIAVNARRLFTDKEKENLQAILSDKILKQTEVIEMYSMVAQGSESRLSEIKMIDSTYPIYGGLETTGGTLWENQRDITLEKNKIWVSQDLANVLNLEMGSQVKIGTHPFEVSHIITEDSSSSWRGVSLAPRLYMNRSDIEQTGLIQKGTTLSQAYLYKLEKSHLGKDSLVRLKKQIYEKNTDPAFKVRTPENTSGQVARVFGYLSNFLSLVSLVSLLIVSMGLIYLFRSQLQKRLKEMAVLKSVGFSITSIQLIYLYQLFLISLISGLMAMASSSLLLPIVMPYINPLLNIEQSFSFDFTRSFIIILIGSTFVLLCCLPWITKLKSLNTSVLFQESGVEFSLQGVKAYAFAPMLFGFIGLAIWQSNSFKLGLLFCLTFLGSILVVAGLFYFITNWLKKKPLKNLSLTTQLIIKVILKRRLTSFISILSLAMGTLLVMIIFHIKAGLITQIASGNVNDRPNLFLFDIQEEQIDELRESVDSITPVENLSAMIRGRISQVNGKEFKRKKEDERFETREEEAARRMRNRGVNLSYRGELDSSEEIVSGEPYEPTYNEEQDYPFISVEKRYARRMGFEIGDVLTFDIQGVEIEAMIKNIRKVKWTSFKPNFFIQFQNGVLEDAPKSFIATMRSDDKQKLQAAQSEIVKDFSNISIIDISSLMKKVLEIFDKISFSLFIMTYLCLLVGLIVFYSIVQSQSFEKSREVGLLKILGMHTTQIKALMRYEILMSSAIALFFGILLGAISAQVFLVMFFDGNWTFNLTESFLFLVIYFTLTYIIVNFVIKKLLQTKAIELIQGDL
jgi:putative ABC transport system permease protein